MKKEIVSFLSFWIIIFAEELTPILGELISICDRETKKEKFQNKYDPITLFWMGSMKFWRLYFGILKGVLDKGYKWAKKKEEEK